MPGDIFQLGNTSYRILKVHSGKVFVEDCPRTTADHSFWFGEAPGRSDELSTAVSRLRTEVDRALKPKPLPVWLNGLRPTTGCRSPRRSSCASTWARPAPPWTGCPRRSASSSSVFLTRPGTPTSLCIPPTAPGSTVPGGLALRKRFCRRFNFELQAAALEDTIVISLGVVHSFPLEEVVRYLAKATVADCSPRPCSMRPSSRDAGAGMPASRLAVRRFRNGKRAPAFFQRADAEDLLATVFPDQLACAENLAGERETPGPSAGGADP